MGWMCFSANGRAQSDRGALVLRGMTDGGSATVLGYAASRGRLTRSLTYGASGPIPYSEG